MTERQIEHLKEAFLAAFAASGNVSAAARVAGCGRTTVYGWQEHDDAFAAAFRDAEVRAIDALEEEARRRAVEGVRRETGVYHLGKLVATEVETKYSDTLLIFLLKGLRPEKYRERLDVQHSEGPTVKAIDRDAWDAV